MTTHTHLGHIFHIAGEPKVTEAAAALVSIPDGALVLDDSGRIVFCGTGAVRSLPLDPFWLYRTRASVIGSAGASQRAFRAGLELLDRGSITPKIDAIVPLEEIHGGYEKLRTRGNRGKLVVAI